MSRLEKINLWSDRKAAPADPKETFQPYLELYLLPGDTVRGMVIVLPGGGYTHRAAHEGAPVAERFNALGFHAAVVQYRIKPYTWPAPQEDALRAVKLTRAYASKWAVNPDKIALLGFSAGGHVAATAALFHDQIKALNGDAADRCSARPDATVLGYSVLTTATENTDCVRRCLANLLGKEDSSEEELQRFSCADFVNAETPPAFLWHTAADGVVPVENSLIYATALSRKKIPFELHVYPRGNHGLGLGTSDEIPEVRNWLDLCAVWLKKMGF